MEAVCISQEVFEMLIFMSNTDKKSSNILVVNGIPESQVFLPLEQVVGSARSSPHYRCVTNSLEDVQLHFTVMFWKVVAAVPGLLSLSSVLMVSASLVNSWN